MDSKMWYQSRALISLLVGIGVMIYRSVKENIPALSWLPLLPDNIVDIIVTALIGGGIAGRVVATKTIRKQLLPLIIALCLISGTAYADLIPNGSGKNTNMKLSATAADSISMPEAGSILAYVTAAANRLGVREGVMYDKWGSGNYAAATLYTLPQVPLSIDFGVTRLDGIAATVDYNAGSAVPGGSDPLTDLLQYLYVGGGAEGRYFDEQDNGDKSWQASWLFDAQFKGSF